MIHQACSTLFYSIKQLLNILFLEFSNILKDNILKFMSVFVQTLKEWPMEILTLIFQTRFPFSTVNYQIILLNKICSSYKNQNSN